MKNAYLKICRLLAASGHKMNELEEFAHELRSLGSGAFLSDIDELRHMDPSYSAYRHRGDVSTYRSSQPPSDAALKIERLLLHDAGMPRTVAIEILTEELRRRFPSQDIPPESRKGFGNWIRRLSQDIPEKDLLFVATGIRNRVVHDAPTDWRLK